MTIDELTARFTAHPTSHDVGRSIDHLRNEFRLLAIEVLDTMPHCRERSLALTKLEEASMWVSKGLALEGGG